MHDPLVVAFDVPRPWPRRAGHHDAKPGQPRWQVRLHHTCGTGCHRGEGHGPAPRGGFFPWWKPSSYSRFWTVAGRGYYWPALVTVWHQEPRARDSGEVCPHYRRVQDEEGKWRTQVLHGWRWHVHHWKLQVPALQDARRRLLTRCAWCGGRSTKRQPVNVSHQWDSPRTPWWRGKPGVYHMGCSSAVGLDTACVCAEPWPTDEQGYAWGTCGTCSGTYRKDLVAHETRRRAIALAGRPERGKPWQWPTGLDAKDVKRELQAAGLLTGD